VSGDRENDPAGSGGQPIDDQWLVALCGLPGVGKSTVAGYITDRLDATRLRTDAVRKELFPDPDYTDAETDTVYRELCDRAGGRLEDGESVVLDATFAERTHRRLARGLASEHGVPFRLVRVVCDREIAERRIADREDISDADVEVYRRFRDEFDAVESDHVTVDNSDSKADTRAQVERLF
jgi:predicted kinase